ncbi:MAG: hypothetical protein NXI14_02035 [bacterium]|nr:hypothetical protein [bacterium]
MGKKQTIKLTKREREEAKRKLLVAATLSNIAKKLEREAAAVELDAGGYPLDFQLTVDDSTVRVGEPTTGKKGYQFGFSDVLVAALYNIENFEEVVTWAIDTLKQAKSDRELATELKAFKKIVTDHSEGRQADLRLRTPASTSRGARAATIGGLVLEGRVGTEAFDIALAGDE